MKTITYYWSLIYYSTFVFFTKLYANRRPEVNRRQAGGLMIGLTGFILLGLFNSSQLLFSISLGVLIFKKSSTDILFLGSIISFSLFFNYLVLFKDDNYLLYFKQFDVLDSSVRAKYFLISFLMILFITGFLIFSFRFLK